MRLFALFGDPVSHSLSPRLHNSAIINLGLRAAYVRHLLKNGDNILQEFNKLGLSGANVTIPHKEAAAARADVASEFVSLVGAANTLVKRGEKIYAYNTDAPGFLKSIMGFGEIKKVLVLGAGGTALALAHALRLHGASVSVLNRGKDRLKRFSNDFQTFSHENFTPYGFDLVLNTTSAGLKDELLPAPADILAPTLKASKFAFDVIYGKKTPFLALASTLGLAHKDGLEMLLHQAVLAFNIFYENIFNESKIFSAMSLAPLK